jgi:hypothetical protein
MTSIPDPQNDLLNSISISRIETSLAVLLRRLGRQEQAVGLESDRLELWRFWNRKLPDNPFVLRQLEAATLHAAPIRTSSRR